MVSANPYAARCSADRRSSSRCGFTLIELLVSMAIMSMLAAVLFPVLASARASARRTACISNLRQLGLALQMYKQDNGELPLQLSQLNSAYVRDTRVFVCPNDGGHGKYPGNPRLEGNLYLPSGVSYDYVPQWTLAQMLGWWNPGPAFGEGKWDDLTPVADCQWHWATTFNAGWTTNTASAHGWQIVLTLGASVRKVRVEDPVADFTPDRYR